MIGKAKSIAHTQAAIDYALKKDKAIELMKEKIIGKTGKEIAEEFKMYQQLNHNCINNTISVVLSPAISDGKQLKNKDLREITKCYLEKMGLQDHQFIAIVHNDRNHKHIHLIINRINSKGRAVLDSYIGKRTQRAADEIAQERNLMRAKMVELQKDESLKNHMVHIKAIHHEVMKIAPENFDAYKKAMQNRGAWVKPFVRQGKIEGFSVEFKGVSIKASKIWKGMTLKELKPLFKRYSIQKDKLRSKTRKLRR